MSQPAYTSQTPVPSPAALTPAARASAVAAARGPRKATAKKTPPAEAALLEPASEVKQLQVSHNSLRDPRLPGIEVTIEMVTPDLAELYLSRLPTAQSKIQQRSLSRKTVDRYAGDMASEAWPFTGDPIRFNLHGELIDGQHRLRSIVASGITQPMVVIRGLEPDTFAVFDTGRARSLPDALRSIGVANVSMNAGVTRRVFYWQRGGYATPNVARMPNTPLLGIPASPGKLLATFQEYRSEIQGASRRGHSFKGTGFATKTAPPGLVGFLFLLFKRIDMEACEKFFHELVVGPAVAGPEYPIAALRKRLYQRLGPSEASKPDWVWAHFFIHVWNCWHRGESIAGNLRTPPVAHFTHIAKPYDPHADEREPGWEPIPAIKLSYDGDAR